MLLIHCPYCDEDLPGARVRLRRRGPHRPPRRPLEAHRRGVARLPLHPHQPARPPLRALAPHQRLRPLLQRGARDRLRPLPPHLQGGRAPPRHRQPDGRQRMTSYRLPDRGRVDHGTPVRFTFDGKTYTGPRRRHPRLGAARQRRPPDGPVVQVPPPARRRLRRLRRAERADGHPPRPRPLRAEHPRHHPGAPRRPRGRPARTAGRRSPSTSARSTTASARCSRPASTTRPSCGRAPSGTASTSRSSATPPASASRRPSPTPTATPPASPTPTCSSSAPAPPASPRRSPPAASGASRHARRRDRRARRLAPLRALGRHRRQARLGLARRRPRRARRAAERHGDARTTAIGYYHQNLVGLCQRLTDHLATAPDGAPRERLWKVRAGQVVLAQGALEKPLVFDGNDRPGVMLAGAAQTYLNRYGVKVGDRPAIVTAHDSAWHAAFDLAEAGARPAAIVDVRAGGATPPSPTAPAPSASRRCSAAPSPAPPAACG